MSLKLLLALLEQNGEIDADQYMEMSKHGYQRILDDFTNFETLNIVEFVQDNVVKKIKLKPEFSWLLDKKIIMMIKLHN